jgi:hypothetical protein
MENESARREEEAPKERGKNKEDPRERFRRLTSSLPGEKSAPPEDEVLEGEDSSEGLDQPVMEPEKSAPLSDTPMIVFDYPGEEDSSVPPVIEEDGHLESVPVYKLDDADIVVAGEEIVDQEISEPDFDSPPPNNDDTVPPEDFEPEKRVPPPPLGDTPTTDGHGRHRCLRNSL